MAEHKIWKKDFPSKYLGASDLPDGSDLIVQIKDVKTEEVKSKDGRELKLVMTFENGIKPLILNKVNATNITRALQTAYEDEWVGKKIQLYVDPSVLAFGEIVSAVRVREFAPTEA